MTGSFARVLVTKNFCWNISAASVYLAQPTMTILCSRLMRSTSALPVTGGWTSIGDAITAIMRSLLRVKKSKTVSTPLVPKQNVAVRFLQVIPVERAA
jgi:hypothetical protein